MTVRMKFNGVCEQNTFPTLHVQTQTLFPYNTHDVTRSHVAQDV